MPKIPYTPADHSALIASILAKNALPGGACATRLSEFANRLLTTNQFLNLTAITEPEAVALKHFADSVALAPFLPVPDCRLIDVGTGAGFPAVPLALVCPDLRVTAMDSTAKRVRFIRTCAAEMAIPNLTGLVGRAEEVGHDPAHRERYDAATARAVADLRVLSELCLPLVRVGGVFLAMKSGDVEEECREAASAIKRLGGEVREVKAYSLSSGSEAIERTIVVVEKVRTTEKGLPRAYAQMVKKAL